MKKNETKLMSIEELALDTFLKIEHMNALMICNTSEDYNKRKAAFIELARAQKDASDANYKLQQAINLK